MTNTEWFKDVAPYLGVILPAIAAYFAYKAQVSERKKDIQNAARMGTTALAGVVAERDVATSYAQAMMLLADATRCSADATEKLCQEVARKNRQDAQLTLAVDEIAKMRRALDEIAAQSARALRDKREADKPT